MGMKKIYQTLPVGILLLATACGKGDEKSETSNNTSQEEGQVAITGRLALDSGSTGLVQSSSKAVLLYEIVSGEPSGAPQEIELDEEGNFLVNVSNQNKVLDRLRAAAPGDGSVDRAKVKEALPQYANDIDQLSDEQLAVEVANFIEDAEKNGGSTYLLVSMDKSGDAIAESESFQFIGLPTGGASMIGLPSDAIKSDLDFGNIQGDGDEALAELDASTDIFDLSENIIKEFASLSNTLKMIKNHRMNYNADGKAAAEITPWFGWTSGDLAAAKNQFSAPTDLSYMGAGFYIQVNDIGVGFNDVCPTEAAADANASRRTLSFSPPSAITSNGATVDPDSPFSNSGVLTRSSQYSGISCGGSNSGVYIRNDDAESQPNNLAYMLGWGNIRGELPEGLWKLKVDGETKGQFDLSVANPLDDDGKPLVYVPTFKVTTDSENKITKIESKFYFYDKLLDSYREVTDTAAIDRLVSSVGIDISFNNSDLSDVHVSAGSDDSDGRNATFENGQFIYDVISADQVLYECTSDTTADCINYIGMSYIIGSVSYRMELRRDSSTWDQSNN